MDTEELNTLSDKIASKIHQMFFDDKRVADLLEYISPVGINGLAEKITAKVIEGLRAEGVFDTNLDAETIANMAAQIQNKFEPDVVVKRLDE